MLSGGTHFHTACRRKRLSDCRAGRLAVYALAMLATLAFAHMLDRIAAGSTACTIEHPAQCPEGSQ